MFRTILLFTFLFISLHSFGQVKRIDFKTDSAGLINKNSGVDSCYVGACIHCTTTINFQCNIEWKIYDQYGNVVRSGNEKRIDISALPKGGYFMLTPVFTYEFDRR